MTRPFQDFVELCALLDALCEESCTPEQIRRLEELIRAHPQAEAYYIQYMNFHANLAHHFRVNAAASSLPASPSDVVSVYSSDS
jgi:hypothetical protein